MHDIRYIRENPDAFDAALKRRHLPPAAKDLLAIDAERRAGQTAMQELQAKRNTLSREIGLLKSKGDPATDMMTEVAAGRIKIAKIEETEKELAAKLDSILSSLPNIPASDIPDCKDEKDNKEIRKSGEPKKITGAKQHYELGEALGLMDFTTAAKLSGARFTMLKGALARMERALGDFMLDHNTKEFGYTEISPPLMVRENIMFGTGQLPKFAEDQYLAVRKLSEEESLEIQSKLKSEGLIVSTDKESNNNDLGSAFDNLGRTAKAVARGIELFFETGLWLIPTSEVPLTNIVNGDILEREKLPFRFTAKTPCFRAEAGAAGKDTRGMLRQHQFYKVEMVSITSPDQSEAEHERMTGCAEAILKKLELPFRTVVLCAGDMGFSARKTYDIEVWLPGQNAYREISSCSNCGDFQARRMNARCRSANEKNTEFVHTLNGSGVAVGRCLIAIMENFQQPDGSISIPPALRPYMDGLEAIR